VVSLNGENVIISRTVQNKINKRVYVPGGSGTMTSAGIANARESRED